jgi:hypothetical protein
MAPTAARRNFAADFARDVGARTGIVPGHVWAAVLNADNATYSINLTANGVTTVKFAKVFWPGSGSGALTDSTYGDTLNIYAPDGSFAITDTLAFLNNLN